jgi:hypothetical protein
VLSDSLREIEVSSHPITDMKMLEGTVSAAACFKNQVRVYNLEREKEEPVFSWGSEREVCLLATSQWNSGLALLALDSHSVLTVLDMRQHRPALACDLGFRGMASCLLPLGEAETLQSTLAGMLVRYDIRANQVSAAFQYLNISKEPQPILRLFALE